MEILKYCIDTTKDFPLKKYYKIDKNFENKETINPHAVNPEYLKLTEAEESKLN